MTADREELRRALETLVNECVNPGDGAPFEAGEWPALDRARAALAIHENDEPNRVLAEATLRRIALNEGERVPDQETFWLLERSDGEAWALYTSSSGIYVHSTTDDVWRAGRFKSERHAHDVWRMLCVDERKRWQPVEHMFINKVQDADGEGIPASHSPPESEPRCACGCDAKNCSREGPIACPESYAPTAAPDTEGR